MRFQQLKEQTFVSSSRSNQPQQLKEQTQLMEHPSVSHRWCAKETLEKCSASPGLSR